MLPVQLLAGAWLRGLSGRALDFEGLACDAQANRYLVSESQLGVLKLPPAGEIAVEGQWLNLDPAVYSEGESRGLWQQVNALAEGVAIDAARWRAVFCWLSVDSCLQTLLRRAY